MPSEPQAFPNFKDCTRISFEMSQGQKLTGTFSLTVASGASTWASTCHLWSQLHKSCILHWFSKQSAIMLASVFEQNMGPKGWWNADVAFGLQLFERDFAIGHIPCGVTL
jgi:hypothetical protein